jgi:hypothetical protein
MPTRLDAVLRAGEAERARLQAHAAPVAFSAQDDLELEAAVHECFSRHVHMHELHRRCEETGGSAQKVSVKVGWQLVKAAIAFFKAMRKLVKKGQIVPDSEQSHASAKEKWEALRTLADDNDLGHIESWNSMTTKVARILKKNPKIWTPGLIREYLRSHDTGKVSPLWKKVQSLLPSAQ